jgi:SARP family transcriptional regulator, regulator of embCAB operon
VESATKVLSVLPALRLNLLGSFRFYEASRCIAIPMGSERLLAFLAISRRPVPRLHVAGALWPDVREQLAFARLRSALWRLEPISRHALEVHPTQLSLSESVRVDLYDAQELARRLMNPAAPSAEPELGPAALAVLSTELLPGWYEDWTIAEAEAWRQLRLHALEWLANRLAAAQRFGEALDAAHAAIQAEPLRESARATVIRVHLAEGNQSEALREFDRYRQLLWADAGLVPTARLSALVVALRREPGVRPAAFQPLS